ncbi:MBL fold metallo-hydrolase [Nocardia sp. IBHARD005]|uniref:MBL fold metallo-hydrolase n=1 Tax=Nocardia sp. IBHARD005 TaxID=3457765 RepID=UPI00405822DF
MLKQVAEGVLVHQSEILRNNTVVVQGTGGVLLIDPGITSAEMVCLAKDLRELGQPVVAGFSTHPDWDHVLWHTELGVHARRDARVPIDPRVGQSAEPGWEWVNDIHEGQFQRLARTRGVREETPG